MAVRILIVDDNHRFLAAARDVLDQNGVTVAGTASTIAEALQVAARERPDVSLVDVDLGEESGFDLAQQLSTNGGGPVILISVYAESELADLIADSPAIGFVSKADLCVGAVLSLLDRAPGRDDPLT
jgi:CheY-like chemotaxis protein